jgi:two-component system, cell cycle sensor histidine kinase PleC
MAEIQDKEYQNLQARLKELEAEVAKHKQDAEEASLMMTLLHDSNDAIIIHNLEGRITSWNRGAELMFGYSEQEARQMNIWQIAPPNKAAEQKAFIRRIFAGENISSFETQRLTKDGRLLDVWMTVTKLVDDAEKVIGIAATERDITVRRGAEEEMRKKEIRLNEAQELGRFGNWEYDIIDKKLFWSDQVFKLYERDFSLGHPTTDEEAGYYSPEQARILRDYAAKAGKTGEELKYDFQVKLPSGKTGYFHGIMRPIKDEKGKAIKLFGIVQDFTERKELEKILEYAESVINTVREPLISLDQDLRVVTASRSFYEFFKVKSEETVGQLIYDLGNKQWDIPKLRELLENILPQKTTFDNYEVEHDFATIGRRIMLLNARQIHRVLGKERIILLAIEDITVRKEIEAGLVKANNELNELATELKRAARVKSEFLANMSHELRTPLNSIIGFSEVLYDQTFGPLNEKQKKYANNVLTSGKHLLLLINQILDMAKVESGKMTLSLFNLPMKSLLNEISLLVADMAGKKKIEMAMEIAADLPNIEADELKIKEIMYNLLSNAIKFTPAGGKIGLRAKKTDSVIEIVVWDTGIGIAPENMEKIFEGFFRVDTPYSRVTEGTGLGLPLSKKLVELHGGKLSVESAGLNKGTSVRFTLPIIPRRKV